MAFTRRLLIETVGLWLMFVGLAWLMLATSVRSNANPDRSCPPIEATAQTR